MESPAKGSLRGKSFIGIYFGHEAPSSVWTRVWHHRSIFPCQAVSSDHGGFERVSAAPRLQRRNPRNRKQRQPAAPDTPGPRPWLHAPRNHFPGRPFQPEPAKRDRWLCRAARPTGHDRRLRWRRHRQRPWSGRRRRSNRRPAPRNLPPPQGQPCASEHFPHEPWTEASTRRRLMYREPRVSGQG